MNELGCPIPRHNAYVDLRMRVAMTLAYLAQEGGFIATASLFGVSKATVITYVNQVCLLHVCFDLEYRYSE